MSIFAQKKEKRKNTHLCEKHKIARIDFTIIDFYALRRRNYYLKLFEKKLFNEILLMLFI